MYNIFIVSMLVVQALALTLLVFSRKVAPDLRTPTILLIVGSLLATLISTTNLIYNIPNSSLLQLAAATLSVLALSHFIFALSAPRLLKSGAYWTLQTALMLAGLISLSTAFVKLPTNFSLLSYFSSSYNLVAVATATGILVALTFFRAPSATSSVANFRLRSARKILLWSLLLSVLLTLSLPVAPAMASATAAWCACATTFSTGYIVYERRFFLYDCARKALAESGNTASYSAIASAATTIDSLGDLLGLPHENIKTGIESNKTLLVTGTSSNQPLIASQAIFAKITSAVENEDEQFFQKLLSAEDSEHAVISMTQILPQIERLNRLSNLHFGTEIVGSSYQIMEIFRTLREDGREHRISVIRGEIGVGKQLLAKAIHNLRGNQSIQYLKDIEDVNHIMQPNAHSQKSVDNMRKTIILSLSDNFKATPATISKISKLQTSLSDVILLVNDPVSTEYASLLNQLPDTFNISIAPLRERPEDLLYQAIWLVNQIGKLNNQPILGIKTQALRELFTRRWTENTTELGNVVNDTLTSENCVNNSIVTNFIKPTKITSVAA